MASKKNPWKIKDGVIRLLDDSQANRKLLRKWITSKVLEQGNTKGYTNILLGKNNVPHRLGSIDKLFNPDDPTDIVSLRNKATAAKAKAKKNANMSAPNQKVLDWVANLDAEQMWPEGKSLDGFTAWALKNYSDMQDVAKWMGELNNEFFDAGHAVDQGFSSKTGLAPQFRYHAESGNQNLKGLADEFKDTDKKGKVVVDKDGRVSIIDPDTGLPISSERGTIKGPTDNVRTKADLADVDVAYNPHQAFFEYLNEGNEDLNFLTQEGFTPEQKKALLFDTEFDPTARGADIKIRDEILNAGVSRRFAQVNGLFASMADSKAGRAITGAAGKGRTADLIGQTGMHLASGNIVGASIAGTTLAATQALENPAVQRRIARQIAQIVQKRGAKTALKMMPGLDVAISGAEAWGYLSEGKMDQAAIAAMSGAIGWIPVIGDGASAALDLTNTGLDIARLDYDGIGAPEPETKTKVGEVPDTKPRGINDPLKAFARAV